MQNVRIRTENMTNKQTQETRLQKALLEITTESWRLKKIAERTLSLLDANEQRKNTGKINWFERKLETSLEECGYKLVSFEGQPYTPGIPPTAINLEDFEPEDELYINQTIEPTILDKDGRILKSGIISLTKAVKTK